MCSCVFGDGDFSWDDECRAMTSPSLNFDSFLEEGLGPTFSFGRMGGVLCPFEGVTEKVAIVPPCGFIFDRQDVPEQGGFVPTTVFMHDIPAGAVSMLAPESELRIFGALEDVVSKGIARPWDMAIKT